MSVQRRTCPPRKSRVSGFTFPELLVVISVGGLLGAALLPSLNTAKETVNAAVCLGNMHQWGMAISMYCEDWNDYIPAEGGGAPMSARPYAWYNILSPYTKAPSLIALYAANNPPRPTSKSIYSCPSVTNFPANPTDANPYYMYGLNGRIDPNGPALFKRAQCVKPADTIMFCENEGSFSSTNGKYCPARHSGGSNFAFVDGHAGWLTYNDYCRECPASPGLESDSSALGGDWKTGIKYHWFPFKGVAT